MIVELYLVFTLESVKLNLKVPYFSYNVKVRNLKVKQDIQIPKTIQEIIDRRLYSIEDLDQFWKDQIRKAKEKNRVH